MAFLLPRHSATYVNNTRYVQNGSLYLACSAKRGRIPHPPCFHARQFSKVRHPPRTNSNLRISLSLPRYRINRIDYKYDRSSCPSAFECNTERSVSLSLSLSRHAFLRLAFFDMVACAYLPSRTRLSVLPPLARERDKYLLFKIPVLAAWAPR